MVKANMTIAQQGKTEVDTVVDIKYHMEINREILIEIKMNKNLQMEYNTESKIPINEIKNYFKIRITSKLKLKLCEFYSNLKKHDNVNRQAF